MDIKKVCKTCGVPLVVSKSHIWNPDGTITQRRDPDHRLIFFESDSFNELFKNIENLIGLPLEKIVIESKARATKEYVKKLLPGARGLIARIIGLRRIAQRVIDQGKILGYGKIMLLGYSWKENYITVEIENPYSLPLFCGDLRGANEAVKNVSGTVAYQEIRPGKFQVKAFLKEHAPELRERLRREQLPRKKGDITYHRCPSCNIPIEISNFKWDFDSGIISQKETGLRMAILGPDGIQAVLDELEAELGETIPEVIIKAQKMHVLEKIQPRWKYANEGDIRNWLAIQGLGNLVSLEAEGDRYSARIENPCLPLLIAGTGAAFYEFLIGKSCSMSWKVEEDGDLILSFEPA